MEQPKSTIGIENFIDLISLGTIEYQEKYLTKEERSLTPASFRINIEPDITINDSKSSSPTRMEAIPISPIISIEPSRNFSTESQKVVKQQSSLPFKLSVMPASETDAEKSMHLLGPGLEKLRISQHTPSFPVKSGEDLSWENFSFPLLDKKESEPVQKGLDVEQTAEIEKKSDATYFELPFINEPKVITAENDAEVKILPLEVYSREEDTNQLTMEVSESVIGMSFEQNNETIVFSESLCQDTNSNILPSMNRIGKSRILFKNCSNPILNKVGKAGKPLVSGFSVTPLVKLIKSSKAERPMDRKVRKNVRTRDGRHYSSCHEFQCIKSKAQEKEAHVRLPKIKHSSGKAKSRVLASPYMSDWGKSTLKAQFNLDLKIHKDPAGVRVLITKCVKRRAKVLK